MTARGNEEKSGDESEDERVEGQGSPLRAGSDDFISSPSAILLINTVPPSRVVCTRGRGSSNSTEPENDRGDFHISDRTFQRLISAILLCTEQAGRPDILGGGLNP